MADRSDFLPALRSRDFRLIVGGQLVSLIGSQMQQVGVAWQLWQLTHSAWSLGVLGFFRVAPIMILGIGGGVVADAVDRRRLMITTQLALASTSAVLALATWSGHISPAAIYGLAALAGVASSFDAPSRQALIPLLVPREHLANALSLHTTAFQLASVIGPGIGGIVLASAGLVAVYVCDAASFLVVVAALLVLHYRASAAPSGQVNLRAVSEGIEFLRRRPILLSTMLLDFFATFFGGSMLLMPIFADQLLKVGPQGLGALYAAQPAGALVAAVGLSFLPPIRRQGPTVLWSVVAYGAAIAVFGASDSFTLAVVALAISGAADTVSMVVRQTLRQLLTPDEMRGRVTAVGMIFFRGGPQLGEVEAGAVAKLFDARVSVVSGGILCVLAAAATAWLVPTLRRYRDRAQEGMVAAGA
jgi:MFS family permease